MSLYWDLPEVFLIIRLEFGVSGRRATEVKVPPHHIISRVHTPSTGLTTIDADLDRLPEKMLSDVSTVKLLLFPLLMSPLQSSKGSHQVQPMLWDQELCSLSSWVKYLHKLFGILHRFISSPLSFKKSN